MQTLAMGVGDLKKVLSGVKTRGILGEIQLGAILEQILPPEQYETNVVTKRGSGNPVEYAIKLPGDDDGVVYLPCLLYTSEEAAPSFMAHMVDVCDGRIAIDVVDHGLFEWPAP